LLTDPLFFGGEVNKLFPEAAVLTSPVKRRLFDNAVDRELISEVDDDVDEEEQFDFGQENRFDENDVLAAAEEESTLPEYIFELAKVFDEEEFEE
uniref:DUF2052 domain-containing protein n=1 Tax=Hymenolepis diminuta TaxID=6216 RepID=A0A0R3SLK7_HYMDI